MQSGSTSRQFTDKQVDPIQNMLASLNAINVNVFQRSCNIKNDVKINKQTKIN
jgi:hypothetical protein